MRAKRGEGARRMRSRAYYEAHREDIIAKANADYTAHREERLAQRALYRAAHADEISEAGRRYRDANRLTINARQRLYRANNPEKVAANKKRWYEANREHVAAKKRAWAEGHRDHLRDQALRSLYGITLAEYNALLAAQGGVCGSCGGPATGRRKTFHVDHDHRTRRVRGLLCDSCNLAIGKLGDDVEGVERALEYLIAARRRAAVWTEAVA
jgi:hypothetical protein